MNGAGGAGSLYDNIGYNNTAYAFELWGNGWNIYDNCFYGQPGPQVADVNAANSWVGNYYSDLAGTNYPIGGGFSTDWHPVMSNNSATTAVTTLEVWDAFDVDFDWIDGAKCDPTALGLAAYSFTVNFDETVLEFVPASADFDYGYFGDPDPATYVFTDNGATGSLTFEAANYMGSGYGDARLAFAQFKVIGVGNTSITISSTYLDSLNNPVMTNTTPLDLALEDNEVPTITVDVADLVGDNTFGLNYNMEISGVVTDNWDLYAVYYRFDDAGSWIHIPPLVDGVADTYGPFTVDLSLITTGDGLHKLNMRVRDQETNYGYVDHDFTLDNTGPDIANLVLADLDDCGSPATGYTNADLIAVSWDNADGSAVEHEFYYTKDVGWGTYGPYSIENPTTFLLDGTEASDHGLYVRQYDAYGNMGPQIGPIYIELDKTPGSPSGLTIDGGAAKTADLTVAVSATAWSVASGSLYYMLSEDKSTINCGATGWEDIVAPYVYDFDLDDVEGVHWIFRATMDIAGNVSDIDSASIIFDETAPEIIALSVTDLTGSECSDNWDVSVHVTFTATDVTHVGLKTNAGTTETFFVIPVDSVAIGSMTVTYTLEAADRLCDDVNTVFAKLRDDILNWGTEVSDNVYVDCSAPIAGAMVLNGGATYADDAVVEVTVSGMSMDIDEYRATETSGDYTASTWLPFDPTDPVFSYDFGTPAEAAWVSLYVQFRDCADRESGEISDAIIFDLTAPLVVDVEINGGAAYTNNATVSVDFTLTEVYPKTVCISEASDMSNATCVAHTGGPYSFVLLGGDGTRTVFVQVEDNVGNMSTIVESTPIELDETAPLAGDFVVISGNPLAAAGYTNNRGGNTYSFTPGDADIKSILIRNEDNTLPVNGGWFDVSGSYPETGALNMMPYAGATCTIEWYYRDFAGNQSGPFYYTINYSNVLPPSAGLAVVATPNNCTKIEVTNPGPDDQFYFFRYNFTGDYPLYTDGVPPHPAIDEGFAGMEMGTGLEHIYAAEWLFDNPLMDIFSFSVWVVNMYGNTSLLPNTDATGEGTNYYLGDFDNSGVLEFVGDFGNLATHYGLEAVDFTPVEWADHSHCDIATDVQC